jgi:uncharacterized protein
VFFHVRDLEIRASGFDTTIAPGVIDFEGEPDRLRQVGPVVASGKAELLFGSLGEIRVSGHLTVEMEADCDRCLEPAQMPLDTDFALSYRPMSDGFGDEKEIDADEAEMGFYTGDGVELNDVLREFVLLTLPMQRVCKETCQGLCPVCGLNRNLNQCQCQPKEIDYRWAALKNLK